MQSEPSATPVDKTTSLLRDHLPLVATVTVFTLLGVKTLAVSHGNFVTFNAIIQAASPTQVILTSFVIGVPVLALVGSLYTLAIPMRERPPTKADLFLVTASWLVLSLVFPWLYPLLLLPFVVILFLDPLVRRLETGQGQGRLRQVGLEALAGLRAAFRLVAPILTAAVGVMAVLVLLVIVVSDAPWLAPEVLELNAQPDVVGYVIDESEGNLAVLLEDSRTVRRIDRDDIQARRICSLANEFQHLAFFAEEGPFRGRPLFRPWNTATYPNC